MKMSHIAPAPFYCEILSRSTRGADALRGCFVERGPSETVRQQPFPPLIEIESTTGQESRDESGTISGHIGTYHAVEQRPTGAPATKPGVARVVFEWAVIRSEP